MIIPYFGYCYLFNHLYTYIYRLSTGHRIINVEIHIQILFCIPLFTMDEIPQNRHKSKPIRLAGKTGWPTGEREKHPRPTALVLSSGGTKGIGHLGTLEALYQAGILRDLTAFSGCSVGGVINLLLICGYSPSEILVVALRTKLVTSYKVFLKIEKALDDFGFVDTMEAMKPMREMVENKFDGKMPTLKELYIKTRKYLVFAISDLTNHEPLYIDHISDPDMPAIEAAAYSMLVTGLLTKGLYKGRLVSDGATVDPLPARRFDDGIHRVLCLAIVGTELKPETSYMSYMYSALSLALDTLQERTIDLLNERFVVVGLNLPELSVVDTGKDMNKRLHCYNIGYLTGMHCVAWYEGSNYYLYYKGEELPEHRPIETFLPNQKNTKDQPGVLRQILSVLKLNRAERKELLNKQKQDAPD